MQEFDPRRVGGRLAPRLVVGVLGLAALGLGWRLASTAHGHSPVAVHRTADPGALVVSQSQTPSLSAQQSGFGTPITIPVKAQAGETLQATLPRTFDGALGLRTFGGKIHDNIQVAQGAIRNSLYQSAEAAGAPASVTSEVIKLFTHKLNVARDVRPGDRFRLVFTRKATNTGRLVGVGDLNYAEISAGGRLTRFYGYQPPGAARPEFFDENGKDMRGLALRTPVLDARITSGFGMRLHPILGYTRMHEGIDLGVPAGTPVFAAGDGVVEQARWAGGYGRWMKLRHSGGWETAYGHLSRWAARPGQHVRQGQVIAYSGSTGEATGPHLHYEVIENGVKVNPAGARIPAGSILEGRALAAFRLRKSQLDTLLADTRPIRQYFAAANLAEHVSIQ